MKNVSILLILIAFLQNEVFSQDRNDDLKGTLDWIKNKVENYPVNTGPLAVSKAVFTYDLVTYDISVIYHTKQGTSEIKSNLKDLSFDMALYDGYSFKIGCKTGKCSTEIIRWGEDNPEVYIYPTFELVFDGEAFKSLNLEERMKKAFTDAISMSGGKRDKY